MQTILLCRYIVVCMVGKRASISYERALSVDREPTASLRLDAFGALHIHTYYVHAWSPEVKGNSSGGGTAITRYDL